MDAHHLDHLFDRFYRVDSARGRHGGGSGIGLANVRDRLETRYGDAASLHTEVHAAGGFTATLTLPLQD